MGDLMRVEKVNDDFINIYFNPFYFKDIDLNNKMELVDVIKELIKKVEVRYKLFLSGFYKIKVYPSKKLGVFLNIIKIDDNEFSNTTDFRIVIYPNEKFYLETEVYEVFNNVKKRYYNNKFYIDSEDIENIDSISDMINIIYGNEVKELITNSIVIK